VCHYLRASVSIELAKDVVDVCLDRAIADAKHIGDFGIG
jgi:hypothetical protein